MTCKYNVPVSIFVSFDFSTTGLEIAADTVTKMTNLLSFAA